MDDIGAVGAVQSKGISAAAFRLINTKKLEFKVFNKTDRCIYNMKKYGDISTLSSGDKIKSNQTGVLMSQVCCTVNPKKYPLELIERQCISFGTICSAL